MINRHYTLKPTYTPARQQEKGAVSQIAGAPDGAGSSPASAIDPSIRAENEDDDGYDPYSDRLEERPLFERDPWE